MPSKEIPAWHPFSHIPTQDLAKKNHSNQKVIELLTARCQLMETHLAELEAHETDYQEMQSELQQLQKDYETGKWV